MADENVMAGNIMLSSVTSDSKVIPDSNVDLKKSNGNDECCIHLSKDIYSTLALLIEYNKLNKFGKWEKRWLCILTAISAIIQFVSFIIIFEASFASEGFSIHSDNVIIDDENITIEQFTGLSAPTHILEFREYLWRLFAFFVLLSYTTPFLKSLIDYTVLIKNVEHVWVFIFMVLFQIIIHVGTMFVAGLITMNQIDIINIFSVGISLIILLEVDDYIYKSIAQSSIHINDKLFIYPLSKQQITGTIYAKYSPLKAQMIISTVTYLPLTVNQLIQMIVGNNFGGERGLNDTIMAIIGYGVVSICFIPPVFIIFYLLIKAYTLRLSK